VTGDEFAYLRRFLRKRSGLDLGADKQYLVESRLAPLWRDAGLPSLQALVRRLIGAEHGPLGQAVVEAMATHETMFFRDKAVFETLRSAVLPKLIAARSRTRRLRLWSAAASSGQEAYSLAMMLADMAPALAGWKVSILGTDLSAAAVERARAATYSQFEVQRGLPIRMLLRHFTQGQAGWTASAELRAAVEFRTLNLLHDVGSLGTFDLVLCRNLLIYLDGPTRTRLLTGLAGRLAPDGVLLLGSTESAAGWCDALVPDPVARGFSVRRPGDVLPLKQAG
jgi:chemotaxis protein methyltransferase CheR